MTSGDESTVLGLTPSAPWDLPLFLIFSDTLEVMGSGVQARRGSPNSSGPARGGRALPPRLLI